MGFKSDRKGGSPINISDAASTEIIAAPASPAFLEIDHLDFVTAAANVVTIEDEDGNDIAGPYTMGASGSFAYDNTTDNGWRAPVGKAIHILTTTTALVGGNVQYRVRNET